MCFAMLSSKFNNFQDSSMHKETSKSYINESFLCARMYFFSQNALWRHQVQANVYVYVSACLCVYLTLSNKKLQVMLQDLMDGKVYCRKFPIPYFSVIHKFYNESKHFICAKNFMNISFGSMRLSHIGRESVSAHMFYFLLIAYETV